MRIAMLTDCYLPRLGGIEVQTHDLTSRLVERGHDVVVFTATPGADGQRHGAVDHVDGVEVHRMALRLPWDLPVNPLAPWQLRTRLRGFDVAHVHMGVVSPFATDCAVLTRVLGLPTTMTWHCVLHRTEPAVNALGVVRRWARGGVAMNAVSDVAAAPLRRIVGEDIAVSVLPNGIDTADWRPDERPPREPGVVRFVSAMRLARRKRPVQLVEAMARVRAAVPDVDVRLEILGEGPDRAKVERKVADLGAEGWVSLCGRVPRETLPARYAGADVYVSPSVLESFGIAALEARTAGLPVVSRLGSGVGEFVTDGVNGLLADTDDGLAEAMARLARDEPLRRKMTEHNLGTPPAQDWATVVQTAEREYERAVAAGSRQ
ncbi:MAG: glycosyltransferase family 4 protein [Dermatophilaceae bacterium]